MKKLLLTILFILTQCGYQPIHMNNNLKNLEFNKIDLQGDTKINRKIINALSLVENKNNENLNDLSINSLFEVQETKKNSKGNKFDLIQYQNEIKKNLINEIIEDIILFMNI